MNVMIFPIGSLANLKLDRTLYDNDSSTKVESQLWYETSNGILLSVARATNNYYGFGMKFYVRFS